MLLELRLPYCHSLKEKRSIVKKIIAKIRQKYNVSIAEVKNNDLWQMASVGISIVSNDKAFVERAMETIIKYIELNFDNDCDLVHIKKEVLAY